MAARGVLRVIGPDAVKFLQGLTTQKLPSVERAAFTAFLTPKGRILSDAIVYKTEKDDEVLLDLPSSTSDLLHKHLKLYRLRNKVKIEDATGEMGVVVGESADTSGAEVVLEAEDPRHSAFGVRRVVRPRTGASGSSVGGGGILEALGLSTAAKTRPSGKTLDALLQEQGVLEGRFLDGLIPLEANMELLHGVSFHKGCYVGQELVARTQFKGMVRKRLCPILLRPDSGEAAPSMLARLPEGFRGPLPQGWEAAALDAPGVEAASVEVDDDIVDVATGKSVGKVLQTPVAGSQCAVGMLRLDHVMASDDDPRGEPWGRPVSSYLRIRDSVQAVPLRPEWWGTQLDPASGKISADSA